MQLKLDADRVKAVQDVDDLAMDGGVCAGILVRAQLPDGRFVNADIFYLDKASLLTWLRSRGGENEWAENVVGILLGHGALHGTRN